jgi:putative ABC transport system permease protein
MAEGGTDVRTRRWFDPLLRRLSPGVRSRLFNPAYEDLRQELLLCLQSARNPVHRFALRAWLALRTLALVASCYRQSPAYALPHPARSFRTGLRGFLESSRIMMLHDLRQALRLLVHQPLFSGVTVGILALAMGATTSIFSVVNAVVLRPLPFPDPGRLVSVSETFQGRESSVSPVNFFDWQREARSFQHLAIYSEQPMTLASGDSAEAVDGAAVSSTFFPALGVKPLIGRWFRAEDDRAPGPSSVVLAEPLWRRTFGGSPGVLGRQVMFDGQPFTVIGVVPAGAGFPEGTEAWFSLSLSARSLDPKSRGAHYVDALGRLSAGTSLEQARAEMTAIAARLASAYPRTNEGGGVSITGLAEATVGSARRALFFLLAAVGFLLLVACLNVSGLLLARATTRRGEMALRAALGAGRLAIVRQVLFESLALATMAGVIGTLVAVWATDVLLAIAPADLPRAAQAGVDTRVLAFAALVAMASALAFGCVPAFQAARVDLGSSLKEGRRIGTAVGGRRLRGALVAAEVALALVLLVGASLAIRSFEQLTRVSPGFDPRGILTFTVSLPEGIYKEDGQVAAFFERLIERLDRSPGVASSGAVMVRPVSSSGFSGTFSIDGRAEASGPDEPRAQMRPITPGYLRTLAIPIVRGRAFDTSDHAQAPPVAVISETAARRYWPGEDPIGRRLRMHVSAIGGRQPFREIVGVAGDVKHSRLDAPAAPMVYIPHAQHPASWMSVMVRSAGDLALAQNAATEAVREADKMVVPLEMEPLEAHVATSTADQRFRAVLLGLFGSSAFLLAIVGLYAVVSYATAQRRHEFGIRMAVGASTREIARLVLSDGMRPVVAGLALGCAGAYGLSRAMQALLFGVRPFEPGIVGAVAAGFTLAALAACYLPARRATRMAATLVLRQE